MEEIYTETKKEKIEKLNKFCEENKESQLEDTAEDLSIRFGTSKSTVYDKVNHYNIKLSKTKICKTIKPVINSSKPQKQLFNKLSSNTPLKFSLDIILNQTGVEFINTILNSFRNKKIILTIEQKD